MNYEPRDDSEYPEVDYLPPKLEFAFSEEFRTDVIAFARFGQEDTVMTNLPVHEIPAELAGLCRNIAEQALLAYVITLGHSTEFAHLEYSLIKMRALGREFGDKFLKSLSKPDTSLVISLVDMDSWFGWHRRYGWGRSIKNPPGTEYA